MSSKFSPPQAHRRLATIALCVLCVLYAAFEISDLGPWIYDWSKSLAGFDIRQHLGISKRFLWQYIHLFLQCGILFVLPLVFVGSVDNGSLSAKIVRWSLRYWLPIFLFHFPILFFVAALIDHDPSDLVSRFVLLSATLGLSIACGWICFRVEPAIKALGRRIRPRQTEISAAPEPPFQVSGAFSRALDLLKLLAAACVILGHFSFDEFTTTPILVFDGHAPRFSIPLFFCISGYLAAFAMHRSHLCAAPEIFKRYWATMPVVIPMLIIVPLMNRIGFAADAKIYTMADEYMVGGHLGLSTVEYFFSTVVLAMTFMMESVWLTILIDEWPLGGVGAFNNAPFWFMCYLIPYQLFFIIWVRLRGWVRIVSLCCIAAITGPPIWLLAPTFFGGVLVYHAHLRYRQAICRTEGG